MVTGRPPKDDDRKRNRVPMQHDWIDVPEVAWDGPTLDSLHPGKHWHDATLAWWETVRSMPHCATWWPSDWIYAARTAFLWNDVHSDDGPAASMIGQISRREDRLGLTEAARRQQRIRYVPAVAEATPRSKGRTATAAERRGRVLKAVESA